MRLAKLTGLEIDKLEAELSRAAQDHRAPAGDPRQPRARMNVIKEEMREVRARYGDDRRTEILTDQGDFTVEDLIAEEDMVITISHPGYIKRLPVSTYRRQRRGGRGISGQTTTRDDWVEHLFIASTHDYLLFFTDPRPALLAQGARDPAGGPRGPGQADCQPASRSSRATRSPRWSRCAPSPRSCLSCSPPARAPSRRPAWLPTATRARSGSARSTSPRMTS